MDSDDVAYRRSVRNTLKVLAVVVVVLVAALVLSAYFDVAPSTFQTRTSVASSYPFTLTLTVNTTSIATSGRVAIAAWINETGTANVTASSSWPVDHSRLWWPDCQQFWPIGIGIMQGHYTTDNFSLGSLVPFQFTRPPCPLAGPYPWFYFNSQTSKVLVAVGGAPMFLTLASSVTFGPSLVGAQSLAPGVYTVVAADEWGDLVMTSFRVS